MKDSQADLLLVRADALPEVYAKVLKAKQLLSNGSVQTAAGAAKTVGISRSVFYKYRDVVFPYNKRDDESLLTMHLVLRDQTGVLSSVLAAFAKADANILTVNQNIPTGGTATVSIAARIDRLNRPIAEFTRLLMQTEGVIRVERMVSE